MADASAQPSARSDLPVRAASALVMLAVAGVAVWLGGAVWAVFVALIAIGVLLEWSQLVMAFAPTSATRMAWHLGGLAYVGLACATLVVMRSPFFGIVPVLTTVGAVIAVDVGAYFAGRTFGGPKIAPRISPSKTWSGLVGGIIGAALFLGLLMVAQRHGAACDNSGQGFCTSNPALIGGALLTGAMLAVIAQTGDFFESWLKRRAGVKDSGRLIPGHGGLFDRVDGLIAVMFAIGVAGIGFGLRG